MWCVVHFTLDDTVEVVPALWYRKEGNCAWPKTSNIKDIKMAVINKTRPTKHGFSFYEARCLARNIGKHYYGELFFFVLGISIISVLPFTFILFI